MTVCGWVDRFRDMGGLLFLDVRDHSGIVQVRGWSGGGRRGVPGGQRSGGWRERSAMCSAPSLLRSALTLPRRTQVVCTGDGDLGGAVRQEWVVSVSGMLQARKDANPRIPSGAVELVAESLQVLNTVTRPLPFPVSAAGDPETPK